jgi:hypothetical protein
MVVLVIEGDELNLGPSLNQGKIDHILAKIRNQESK